MWKTLTGSLLDVNRTNDVEDRLAADFVCDSTAMTIDAFTTRFMGAGNAPEEIHWRVDGQGWIVIVPATRIDTGENDHDFFDLPKLVWPHRYPALAEVCEGATSEMVLQQAGARLLGNGRAHLVTATVDRDLGLIRSYRTQAADGTTLRTVELTYTAD